MYSEQFNDSLKLVEASREKNIALEPARMTAEQKEQVLASFHPDYKMDEFFERLPNEDAYMMPYYAGDYITVKEENEDLAFYIPESGTNIFNDAMCIPVTSEKKDLAEKFINFMLEADIGLLNVNYVGYSTPNQAVYDLLDDEVKNDGISYPEIKDNWEHYRYLSSDIDDLYRELWISVQSENK